MNWLATLLFLLLAAPAAWAMPSQVSAEYHLTSRGLPIGRVKESFVRSGDTYTIHSVSRSEGLLRAVYDEQITLHSNGRVDEGGLRPYAFEERRSRDSRRDVNATFDWERGVMQSRFRGETSEQALPRDTQDRISMMYQFMHAAPRTGNLVLAMSNGRKVEQYTYRLVDEPRISTPLGELETLHFERVTESPRESRAEVWLAKQHHNFPVRIVFDDPRGLRVEQTIVALRAQ